MSQPPQKRVPPVQAESGVLAPSRASRPAGQPRATTQSLVRALREALGGDPLITEGGASEEALSDVFQDAREVVPGSLFVARAGSNTHGSRFVGEALARGARAVLTDLEAELPSGCPCVLRTPDVGRALAAAASHVYADPTRRLTLVGVTGTNGKTSTVWAIAKALEALGLSVARLGTLGFQDGCETHPSSLTTPEADASLRYLHRAAERGARYAIMEVSNVALETQRVSGFDFDVVALTNLSRDHLDFHGSFEAYRAAKARLFLEYGARAWVLNVGDGFGRWLAQRAESNGAALLTVGDASVRPLPAVGGRQSPAGRAPEPGQQASDASVPIGPQAELIWSRLEESASGVRGYCRLGSGAAGSGATGPSALGARFDGWLESPWLGAHNFENVLLALAVLAALGVDPGRAVGALSGVEPPPGRLERVTGPEHAFQVVVDYAHTEDALARVLRMLRPLSAKRLLCVFGCGGDRDRGKRGPMGKAVGALADRAWLTSDNPRTEDPAEIAEQVERGLRAAGGCYGVVLDRAEAIEQAVAAARPGDVLLVAGKGHETQQHLAHRSIAFDDREHVRVALRRRSAPGAEPD